jgi:F420-dependent oxidoreductase-like protein
MRTAIRVGGKASGSRRDWQDTVSFAVESERLGVDFCWSAEAWGQDAIAPLAYVAARTTRIRLGTGVMQISARVPSMAAMTAMTMAAISDERFVLGLGVSGPQVVEGLHGVPFSQPISRMREYLDVLTLAFEGRALEYAGSHFVLPLPGGEGKALRLAQTAQNRIPIYLATLGPKGLELAGERANGWLGSCFIPEACSVYLEPILRGLKRSDRQLTDLDLQAGGPVAFGDDVASLLTDVKTAIAFQIGAMGSPEHNFYSLAYQRAGYADEARIIQRLWLDGRRQEATNAVPEQMALLTSFVGTDEMVRDRLRAFGRAGVTTVRIDPYGDTLTDRLDVVTHFLDLVRDVNNEANAVGISGPPSDPSLI